jgi:hypothetical protein
MNYLAQQASRLYERVIDRETYDCLVKSYRMLGERVEMRDVECLICGRKTIRILTYVDRSGVEACEGSLGCTRYDFCLPLIGDHFYKTYFRLECKPGVIKKIKDYLMGEITAGRLVDPEVYERLFIEFSYGKHNHHGDGTRYVLCKNCENGKDVKSRLKEKISLRCEFPQLTQDCHLTWDDVEVKKESKMRTVGDIF